jgi:hypothetical protein
MNEYFSSHLTSSIALLEGERAWLGSRSKNIYYSKGGTSLVLTLPSGQRSQHLFFYSKERLGVITPTGKLYLQKEKLSLTWQLIPLSQFIVWACSLEDNILQILTAKGQIGTIDPDKQRLLLFNSPTPFLFLSERAAIDRDGLLYTREEVGFWIPRVVDYELVSAYLQGTRLECLDNRGVYHYFGSKRELLQYRLAGVTRLTTSSYLIREDRVVEAYSQGSVHYETPGVTEFVSNWAQMMYRDRGGRVFYDEEEGEWIEVAAL